MKNSNTQRTGWAKAKVQLSGELDYDPDAKWIECDPPQNDSLDLNDDKIEQAERDRDYVNSLIS